MENKIAGLLGAIAALGTLGAAQAAPTHSPSDALKASSYAELLEPVPNAAKILRALDEQAPPKAVEDSTDANVKVAQLYRHHHHHHHHHHHQRRRHHHHHHHHHHAYYSGYSG